MKRACNGLRYVGFEKRDLWKPNSFPSMLVHYSDPESALKKLARMLVAGENPLNIVRRHLNWRTNFLARNVVAKYTER
ncbi:hypothetical protein BC938DRAFT_477633 [Jimgerdemannia flammicorona]|uniref:Uncharacterized protein n=1 Tax=Jimgerdemannia flammicorona TaxID=994334 RepID=A0A433P8K4_9FUNG|nr:hypothetical protein BC938DRAFT_477633 [Jimgerdemannia flammicorona]